MKKFGKFIFFYVFIPLIASIPFLIIELAGTDLWISVVGVPVLAFLLYVLFHKKMDFQFGSGVNGYAIVILSLIFTVMMIIANGGVEGVLMTNFCWLLFPFAPAMLLPLLMDDMIAIVLMAFLTYFVGFLFCTWQRIHSKKEEKDLKVTEGQISETEKKKTAEKTGGKQFVKPAAGVVCVLLCVGISAYLYVNRPAAKYSGHGFEFMHGYSSTDFTDYTVYAKNSKLVTLDHTPSVVFTDEADMPILDGAEACYPLYAAFAKAVYKDIDQIELAALHGDDQWRNGKIVTFTNSVQGFYRLIREGEDQEKYGATVDIFFGARPSRDQLGLAKEFGYELEITPIGKEAFVFFVEDDNPVDEVSSDDLRAVYHGDIVNWADLGGKKQAITAFQRPNGSGSQTMMEYFMGDVSLKEPDTYERVDAMGGVIKNVAQYANEAGAIGYTFRYFLEELNQEKGVKMLTVDGVYPTVENIENGTYPLTVDLCVVTRKDDPNPNVRKMLDFILSEDGQTIIRETGYGPLYH